MKRPFGATPYEEIRGAFREAQRNVPDVVTLDVNSTFEDDLVSLASYHWVEDDLVTFLDMLKREAESAAKVAEAEYRVLGWSDGGGTKAERRARGMRIAILDALGLEEEWE